MLPFIFLAPILQMIILVYAANLEMKEIEFYVVDKDLSTTSRKLVSDFTASPFYVYKGTGFNTREAEALLKSERVEMVLHIPAGFSEDLRVENSASLQLLINAVDASKAALIKGYTSGILNNFNRKVRYEWLGMNPSLQSRQINLVSSFWYNPELDYKIYMLPGILVILVTLIGMFLTALNLVREKELGTSEQINVTPIKKIHFIFGKLFPFWVIAIVELAFGLLLGRFLFDLPILGELWLLFTFAAVYLLVALGIGLFLSTLATNQQQVMFLTFFFMLTFILMSGIFTPVESMPQWAQKINIINPFAYFMKVIRMILLKGSEFSAIRTEFLALSVYSVVILGLSAWRYRKVS
jgi:ABC-2 type transport system permease protein